MTPFGASQPDALPRGIVIQDANTRRDERSGAWQRHPRGADAAHPLNRERAVSVDGAILAADRHVIVNDYPPYESEQTARSPAFERRLCYSASELDLDPIRVVDGAKMALGRSTPSGTSHLDALHHEPDNGPAPL